MATSADDSTNDAEETGAVSDVEETSAADTGAEETCDDAEGTKDSADDATGAKTKGSKDKDTKDKGSAKDEDAKDSGSPKSRAAKKRSGDPRQRAEAEGGRRSRSKQKVKPQKIGNPSWFVPVMLGLMLVGLVWVVTFYITEQQYPVEAWGMWNLGAGFALILAGFAMTTRWK